MDEKMGLCSSKRAEGTVLVLFSYGRKGGSCKRMNGTRRGKSCMGEGGLLLLLIFKEKKFEGRSLEL